MKTRRFFTIMTLLAVSFLSFSSCDEDEVSKNEVLPVEIINYIEQHFPGKKIVKSKIERKFNKLKYEVKLEGGFELEFNERKEVVEIEGITKLPDSVIPPKILAYVKTNYPDNYIIEWELDDNETKQEVKLDNRIELEFTLDGEFIKIDN